jgi:murein DD-endopeptidase MepM/ murein hydrolase activator NlpD
MQTSSGRVEAVPVSVLAAARAAILACFVAALVALAAEPARSAPGYALAPVSAPAAQLDVWRCHEKICQRVSQRGIYLSIDLRNDRDRVTWVVLEPEGLSNMKALQAVPFTVRLAPGEVKRAGLLAIENPDEPHGYRTKWSTLHGNPFARHDERWHYRMPFGGHDPIPISQGYNGKFSHKGLGAFSLDFPMSWGTPILAARGGTIVEVVNDKVASGIRTGENEGDNHVTIEHLDGTFAVYAHLRHGGPARVGQRVQAGDLIGLSGDTGFSTGPHLHFAVFKIRRDGRHQTIPVKFWNGTAAGYTPIAGLVYKPGCPRSGGEMCLPGELASEPGLATQMGVPAAPVTGGAPAAGSDADPKRRADGACVCRNGAILHVDLPCNLACGR